MLFPKPKRVKDRKLRQKIKKPYCEYCGAWKTTTSLEVHHIYSQGGSGPGDIEENLITLCVCCHGKAQRYEISRDELLEIVADRLGKTLEDVKEKILRFRRR